MIKGNVIEKYRHGLCVALLMLLIAAGCRKNVGVLRSETTSITAPGAYGEGSSFYLLNEGNMGSNHCSLDYFDRDYGIYTHNLYSSINPQVTLGLGDVGNDIKIYGGKLYIAVNGSGKVEVLDKNTGVKLCQIEVNNCRRLAFWKSTVLVTSYDGYVGVIDTSRLQKSVGSLALDQMIKVGREPEGLAVTGDLLYVANSGGYSPPNYDNRLSVIDLKTSTVTREITLALNLQDVQTDDYGHVIVSARGDYESVLPSLFVLDAEAGEVIRNIKRPVENFTVMDSVLYYFTSTYGTAPVAYERYNLKTLSPIPGSFLEPTLAASIKLPFALGVDPAGDHRLLIADAGDYITPGTLYWVDQQGRKLWQVQTGEIPGHIAFLQ